MQHYLGRVQDFLDVSLADADVPERLREAMRYSTLAGGKRIRALLTYAAGTAVDAPIEHLDRVAAAIECIHAYSLIHDDLPSMDDDDLRRGLPTNHIQFDEATAILAGDALQTLAFEILNCTESPLTDHQSRAITLKLAQASGANGMVGGQMLDIQATANTLTREQLENVHRRKTGALINAAVMCGALCSESCTTQQLEKLNHYANCLGLAFQVVDDILDIESTTEELGKPSGADVALGKSTYPALIGLEESKQLATNLYQEAIDCINTISDNSRLSNSKVVDTKPKKYDLLHQLAERIVNRNH